MIGSHFIIAIGDNQQRVEFVYPSTNKLEKVERSLVGPVSVFYDQ